MTRGLTERLARTSAARPWPTVAAWLVAVIAAIAVIVLLLGSALTAEEGVTSKPESEQANAIAAAAFPPGEIEQTDEVVVVRSPGNPAAARENATEVERAIRATGVVREVRRPVVSRDGDAVLLPLVMEFRAMDPEETIEDVIRVVEEASGTQAEVTVFGSFSADRDFMELSEDDLRTGEFFFGAPTALVILLLVFGAVVAGLVPLALAVVSIVVGLALTALLGQVFELSFYVVNMLTGMGLALGIDYSLFVLSRYREERSRGAEKVDAIATAGATSSRAVLFSGLAFVLAMFGMVLVPDTILRSLAAGAIIVGIVAVLAALTLLPAVLGLLGDRVNALRIPYFGRTAAGEGRFWTAIVRAVMRRPVISLVASVALLVAAALPILDMKTGFAGISTMPDRFISKQGFLAYSEEFGGGGQTEPAYVVVQPEGASREEIDAALSRLRADVAADGMFGTPTAQTAENGVRLLTFPVQGDATSERAISAVERLRASYIPSAFEGVDARALVTGETAESIDYFALIDRWLPIVFTFVLGLSFVLLTLAFRSIVVSLKAIALNLLSVGAAYGLLVLVFQKGVGNELLGFQQVENVVAWVRCSCSRCSSGCRWTTTCFCSAAFASASSRAATTTAPSCIPWARRRA